MSRQPEMPLEKSDGQRGILRRNYQRILTLIGSRFMLTFEVDQEPRK